MDPPSRLAAWGSRAWSFSCRQSMQASQQQQQAAGVQMSQQQAAQMAQMQGAGGYRSGMMGNDMQNRQGFGQQQYGGFPGSGQDFYNPAYMMGQQMPQNGSGAAPYPLFQQPNMFGFDAREAMAAGYNLGHFQGVRPALHASTAPLMLFLPLVMPSHVSTHETLSAAEHVER